MEGEVLVASANVFGKMKFLSISNLYLYNILSDESEKMESLQHELRVGRVLFIRKMLLMIHTF